MRELFDKTFPSSHAGGAPVTYACAFCGEDNDLDVDPSGGRRQTFTEDCAVCCRPNVIALVIDEDGEASVEVSQEYEA